MKGEFRGLAAAVALVASLAVPASLSAAELGDWTTDDGLQGEKRGRPLYCRVSRADRRGDTTMILAPKPGTFFVALTNRGWDLPGDRPPYDVDVTIDEDRWQRTVAGHVVEVNMLAFAVDEDAEQFAEALRRGYDLEISVERNDFRFDLTGSSRAFDWLRECFFRGPVR